MMNINLLQILTRVFLFGLSIILITTLIAECEKNPKCESHDIISVGGCDKYGKCGVEFNDGTKGTCYYPIVEVKKL